MGYRTHFRMNQTVFFSGKSSVVDQTVGSILSFRMVNPDLRVFEANKFIEFFSKGD